MRLRARSPALQVPRSAQRSSPARPLQVRSVGAEERMTKHKAGLLPCPFCGAEPEIKFLKETRQFYAQWAIRCSNGDHACFSGFNDRAHAIVAWNRRVK